MSFNPFPNDPGASPYPNNPGSGGGGTPSVALTLTPLATDTFNRADGSLGAFWSGGSDVAPTIVSNEAKGQASGASAAWNGSNIWASDHYSKITVGSAHAIAGGYEGPTTRSNATGQNQYAALYIVGTPNFAIYKRVSGTYTNITNTGFVFPVVNTGDIVMLVSEGSQHTAYLNGQPCLTVYDTAIAPGGSPGIATFNAMTIDAWEGGNAQTPVVGTPLQTDFFNRANNGMSVGQAHWSPLTFNDGTFGMVDCPIVSNELNTGAGATGHNGDYRTSESWVNDHYSMLAAGSVLIGTGGVATFIGALTRVQPAGNAGYLACIFGNNTAGDFRTAPPLSYRIYRLDHGSPDSSTLLQACAHNNLVADPATTQYMFVSQGSRQSLRINGKEIMAITDSTYSGGTPGVLLFPPNATGDSWTAGAMA